MIASGIPRRYVIAILAFFGYANMYTIRTNLSVAIVVMTSPTEQNYTLNLNGTYNHHPAESDQSSASEVTFKWDQKEKGFILSSFFVGYLISGPMGGYLTTKFGGASLYSFGIAAPALLTLLTPFAAHIGSYAVIILRLLEGMFEGCIYPASQVLWSYWAPPEERTKLTAWNYAGCHVGLIVTFTGCAFIAERYGWEYTFYVPGILALIWCAVWTIFVRNSPEKDPWISSEEKEYILSAKRKEENVRGENEPYPFKEIFTSLPVWAICILCASESWTFNTALTLLPTYLHDELGYSIGKNSVMSSIPFLISGFTHLMSSWLSDYIYKHQLLSLTKIRKIYCLVGSVIQITFLLIAVFTPPHIAVYGLILSVGFGGIVGCILGANQIDVGLHYAGVGCSLQVVLFTISGSLSPVVASYCISSDGTGRWSNVFLISSVIYALGAAFYLFFGSAEPQWWAKGSQKNEMSQERS